MESYPQQCRAANGETFVEDIGNELEKTDLILLSTPRPNQVVSSPLRIEGQAPGFWFFEGDFPVKIFDDQGEVLGVGFVTAQGEWMTEEFVPFEGRLVFDPPTTARGMLILEKDNPSDNRGLDDALEVPVKFTASQN